MCAEVTILIKSQFLSIVLYIYSDQPHSNVLRIGGTNKNFNKCQQTDTIFRLLYLLDRASLLIVENRRPALCHLLFYFTSYAINMFRTLIYPSSGAYDYSVELPHWSCVLGSMFVGVSVWLGWSGICVAG